MEGLLAPLFDIAIAIATAVIQVMIWLIMTLVSNAWLAHHARGVSRFGHSLAALMAAYLLFGIARPMTPVLYTPALQPLYAMPLVIGAVVLLFVGIAMGQAAQRPAMATTSTSGPDTTPLPKTPIQTVPKRNSVWLALIVIVVIITAIVAAMRTEQHSETLAQRLCNEANARISDTVDSTVRDGAGLLDRILGTETADKIPCAPS